MWEPGRATLMFLENPIVADGSWQDFTFDLRKAKEGTWSGELKDFHVAFLFDPGESGGNVRLVEIDRIILTGFEEQLKGELSPPPLGAGAPPGQLLEEARFTSLGLIGVGRSGGLPEYPAAVLNDFDEDGALDLASAWWRYGWSDDAEAILDSHGWLTALGMVPGSFGARGFPGTGGAYTFLNRGIDGDATSVASGELDPKPQASPVVSVYPNPFNSNVVIRLTKADLDGDPVSMTVYNVAGQPVRSLARGVLAAETHEVLWDGRTDRGELVSSGAYFLRVDTGGRSMVQKMLVAR